MLELEPGRIVGGRYRLVSTLGQGGMGMVFEAANVHTGKRVALKCIDPSRSVDPRAAERLTREAQAISRIRHPNVVDVYDVGRDGRLVFLVMELLEGELLSHALARRALQAFELIALLLPVMRGVAEAHRQGVVHRDLKPENIFLSRQLDCAAPVPKVLDFGISKLEAREQELRALTAAGLAVGTPRYMSYEQAAGERDIDARADVYALGVILYEGLTGRVPYDADTFSDLLLKQSVQRLVPPAELRPTIPSTLSALVMWALERERARRIPSVTAFIRELEPFATERGLLAELASAPPHANARTMIGGFTAPSSDVPKREPDTLRAAPDDSSARWIVSRKRRRRRLALTVALTTVACAIALWVAARSRRVQPIERLVLPKAVAEPAREDAPKQEIPWPGASVPQPTPWAPPPVARVQPIPTVPAPSPPSAASKPAPPGPRPHAPKPRDLGIY